MSILTADYSIIDYEEMASSMGLKLKYIPLLIASFAEESISMLDALERSISIRDYDQIRSNAHAIKGCAGNLKFNEIYEMAKEIEMASREIRSDFQYEAYFEAIKGIIKTISS